MGFRKHYLKSHDPPPPPRQLNNFFTSLAPLKRSLFSEYTLAESVAESASHSSTSGKEVSEEELDESEDEQRRVPEKTVLD